MSVDFRQLIDAGSTATTHPVHDARDERQHPEFNSRQVERVNAGYAAALDDPAAAFAADFPELADFYPEYGDSANSQEKGR